MTQQEKQWHQLDSNYIKNYFLKPNKYYGYSCLKSAYLLDIHTEIIIDEIPWYLGSASEIPTGGGHLVEVQLK